MLESEWAVDKRSRCPSCMANQNNVFSKLLICLADIYFLLNVSLSLNLRFIAKGQKKNLEYIYSWVYKFGCGA